MQVRLCALRDLKLGIKLLRNVGNYLPVGTELHPTGRIGKIVKNGNRHYTNVSPCHCGNFSYTTALRAIELQGIALNGVLDYSNCLPRGSAEERGRKVTLHISWQHAGCWDV